ncbi:MAG: HAMP domain-containing histidine kinase [Anaerolineaceae bacterium]|nr:HAMP domain-containing histidine kinase [Anaerolineaceae bacterium]
MTLRVRLTLLFSSLLGGTLLLFGALVYTFVNVVLLERIDDMITVQADAIMSSVKVNADGLFDVQALREYQPGDSAVYFQVWGNDRRQQFSHPVGWLPPLDPMGLETGQVMFNSAFSRGVHVRVLTLPVETRRGPSGLVQIGMNLAIVDATQTVLASVLVILALVSMGLSAMIASLIVNRALAPLAAATQVATTITQADDLSRRIPLREGQAEDEIHALIYAFNETLARMEKLFTTQRRFVADVSHELRTPLTVIKGEVSLLRKMGEMDEESLSSIESEVDRLTRLVGNLLLLAQAESGRLPLELKPFELDTLVLEVFQQTRVLAGERLTVQLTEIDQVLLTGDRDRLKQVFLNLLGNAVQYTPAGGTVTMSLKKIGEQARIIINDNGPGIPAQDLAHIFERFYRGERSRKRSQGTGFGLGLSIAQWIVKAHQGTIEVSSREGEGTTFCVWLPVDSKNL